MTDRELLELAAKAAGVDVHFDAAQWGRFWVNGGGFWNPLADDGDAFRLAVRLRITPHIDCNMTEAEWANQDNGGFVGEPHFNDPLAATRRAIVRAAAEIGKGMK